MTEKSHRILIGTICARNPVPEYVASLVQAKKLAEDNGVLCDFVIIKGFNTCDRQHFVNMRKNYTHILFIDDDMSFPAMSILGLISRNLDFVASNYSQDSESKKTVTWDFDNKFVYSSGKSGTDVVKYTGMGLFLAKVSALDAMDDVNECFKIVKYGEDWYFCDRAREAGFDIHVDHDLSNLVQHVKPRAIKTL